MWPGERYEQDPRLVRRCRRFIPQPVACTVADRPIVVRVGIATRADLGREIGVVEFQLFLSQQSPYPSDPIPDMERKDFRIEPVVVIGAAIVKFSDRNDAITRFDQPICLSS